MKTFKTSTYVKGGSHAIQITFEKREFGGKMTGDLNIHILYEGNRFSLKDSVEIPKWSVSNLKRLIDEICSQAE